MYASNKKRNIRAFKFSYTNFNPYPTNVKAT